MYALKLVKVVADGITVVTNGAEMIVDSGAKWTVLLSDTFDQLNTVITKAVDPLGYHPTAYRGPNYMYFEDQFFKFFSNWSALPAVELSFDIQRRRFAFRNGDC